jgi:methylglutaconyl-CoA hydratase
MKYQYLDISIEERICYITLNRAEKRNALNFELVAELKRALQFAEENNDCKVIVLRANGDVFSAGADLQYLQTLQKNTFEENVADSNHLKELFQMIYIHPKVIIAQIEGHAIAGGCGLATVADLTYAVPEAQFGYTEVKIGFIPAIVMVFLIRKIGEGKAKELLLTGKLIGAEEALSKGLIHAIVEKDKIKAHVRDLALQLCNTASGNSLKVTKAMIAGVQNMRDFEALDYAAEMNAEVRGSDDCKKGIAAFLNKEKFSW